MRVSNGSPCTAAAILEAFYNNCMTQNNNNCYKGFYKALCTQMRSLVMTKVGFHFKDW